MTVVGVLRDVGDPLRRVERALAKRVLEYDLRSLVSGWQRQVRTRRHVAVRRQHEAATGAAQQRHRDDAVPPRCPHRHKYTHVMGAGEDVSTTELLEEGGSPVHARVLAFWEGGRA